MLIKTILVCLTTPEHAEDLMKVAVPLARRHDAHLTGLHTVEALVVSPGIALHIPEPAFAAFNAGQAEEADAIRKIFEAQTHGQSFPSEFRLLRTEAVSANRRMVECARAADIVIMAHEDPDADRADQRDVQASVIRESGRPVIVVPAGYDGPEVGGKIVLGWSDTREAARAAHDLLNVARPGASVTVLRLGPQRHDPLTDSDGIDMVSGLARHGLVATLEHRPLSGDNIASVLDNVACDVGADLIVTGAFGHSKVYDFVIGATTHILLKDARLPVMFSK